MSNVHTPTPWFVRTQERLGEVRDCFVAAKDVQGLAYDAEILGDDEYRDGIERKLADCRRIVQCVNSHDALVAALSLIGNTNLANVNSHAQGWVLDMKQIANSALSAIASAEQQSPSPSTAGDTP